MVTDAKTSALPRSTLVFVLTVAGAIIMLLGGAASLGAQAWARMIEDRGVRNEARITALEQRWAAIEAELRASRERQQDMLDLLREHMRKQ